MLSGEIYAEDKAQNEDGIYRIENIRLVPALEDVLAKIGEKTFSKEGIQWRIDGLSADQQKQFQTDEQKRDLLEKMIQYHLLALEAKSENIDKEKGVAAAIEDLIEYQLAQTYIKFKMGGAEVSIEEIKKYYEDHLAEFKAPPTVKAQHILIKVDVNSPVRTVQAALQKATSIKKDLDKGADFPALAKKYSDDADSRDKGGDVGFFSRGMMIADFSDAAFDLKTGQISKPVRSILGYHIIKVTDRKDAAQLSLDEVSPTIRATIGNIKKAAKLTEEIEKLKKKYNVVYTK